MVHIIGQGGDDNVKEWAFAMMCKQLVGALARVAKAMGSQELLGEALNYARLGDEIEKTDDDEQIVAMMHEALGVTKQAPDKPQEPQGGPTNGKVTDKTQGTN